ncbi:diaminopimelate epimerase [Anabaenopsis circularis NIES-21]|uniref:Diaminopimelate epimerase n=1 Tax=Anabaenopsis circularis NIES-21 TaxID=1085406 RepID=A0A1Z4GG72_9CYAN|nr:diaminopimelate epimerase [Anabaenopsis circularis NIES-21]
MSYQYPQFFFLKCCLYTLFRHYVAAGDSFATFTPNRTNVQFMQVLNRNTIKIEIWERGAGYTLASGSSSSAAAAVAHKLGLCDSTITVQMPGGEILIQINDDFNISMTGSVTKVAQGELSAEIMS